MRVIMVERTSKPAYRVSVGEFVTVAPKATIYQTSSDVAHCKSARSARSAITRYRNRYPDLPVVGFWENVLLD